MSGLRVIPFRTFRKFLERHGFVLLRCVGSHHVFRHADGRTIVVPDHGAQVITRPLTRKILRDMGITPEEYHRGLEEL